MNIKTNMVVITRNGHWHKMGDCSICLISDEEFKKLTSGEIAPLDVQTVAEMTMRNITHRQVCALL